MAAMARITANLDIEGVLVKVRAATEKTLAKIALQVEGQTKINITDNGQVDTGFMRNSVYSATKAADSFGQIKSEGGRAPAAKAKIPKDARALVAVGANYAVYQEERNAFLFPAAEAVANQARGKLEAIFRESLS